VGINKPFREVLGPAALYICLLDRLHSDCPKPKSSQAEGLVIVARAKCSVSVEATPPFKIKSG
jgi:hypothetical protein